MGQKINPKVLRLNITDVWRSRWMVDRNKFAKTLQQDVRIREYIVKNYRKAGVDRVEIERTSQQLTIIIKTTKPGMLIGRAGGGIEDLKKKLKSEIGLKGEFKINVEEVKHFNLSAQVWADGIAEQIEKRVSHRRALKQAMDQIMDAGAKGVRVQVKGRLGGSEIARSERQYKGSLPLHTFRTDIDYAESTAFTTYCTIGIKVWINRGEVFAKQSEDSSPSRRTQK